MLKNIYRLIRCSDGFAAASIDMDVKRLAIFAKELFELYNSLSGKTRLEEPYGIHSYIEFEARSGGYIKVKGTIHSNNHNGFLQEISFENEFDQTFLKDFAKKLYTEYSNFH